MTITLRMDLIDSLLKLPKWAVYLGLAFTFLLIALVFIFGLGPAFKKYIYRKSQESYPETVIWLMAVAFILLWLYVAWHILLKFMSSYPVAF